MNPKTEHELKCWPEYFQAVKNGIKPFEIRKWDRPYKVGDVLILREYDPAKQDYTGDSIVRQITYILDLTYLPGDNITHFSGYAAIGLTAPTNFNNYICPVCGMTKQPPDDEAIENIALKQEIERLKEEKEAIEESFINSEMNLQIMQEKYTEALEVIEDMTNQFAYECMPKGGRAAICTGGLSALESAFGFLGWSDPKPTPERECQFAGCHEHATCGTPTPDGYKRLCRKHGKIYLQPPESEGK